MDNQSDLRDFLRQFMERSAQAGEDDAMIDAQQTVAAVGLFFVRVGWILRLDTSRYLHLLGDIDSPEDDPTDVQPASDRLQGATL